jgi:LuxR family maltose regulon positive regulatory protein
VTAVEPSATGGMHGFPAALTSFVGRAQATADIAAQLAEYRLTLACPQGYVRVFADEGPPMAALLGRVIAAQRAGQAVAGAPLGYLARLRSAFGTEPAASRTAAVPGLIDPLTSRELEVLEMLAAGGSNQAIAGQLVVTLDTVKKHVSHILGKLGAANRTEAVSRARELRLIP